jgi:uncharacterized membrane protein YkvA (DUF1232 family)
MTWRQQAQRIHTEAQTFYFAFKHPGVPWYAKVIAVSMAAYLFSSIQLIPSFIPLIGFLDDFLVLFLGVKLLQRIIPPDVLAECRQQAGAAEARRKDEVRSRVAAVAVIAIALAWVVAAITVTGMIASYIPLAIKK